MVNLTRIYTRLGDDGMTRLADNSIASKSDPRLEAGGAIDEANCAIGVALTLDPPAGVAAILAVVQNELFDVGANSIDDAAVERLEAWCDQATARLPMARSFVLPGGCPLAAQLHVARGLVRRAERAAWRADDGLSPAALKYLNRLSDLLFQLARQANADSDTPETLWVPGQGTR